MTTLFFYLRLIYDYRFLTFHFSLFLTTVVFHFHVVDFVLLTMLFLVPKYRNFNISYNHQEVVHNYYHLSG